MKEKPPILSDKELRIKAVAYFKKEKDMDVLEVDMDLGFLIQELEAQRDADVAWCEDKVREMIEEIEILWPIPQRFKDKWLKGGK